MKPDPLEPGTYTGEYTADKPGRMWRKLRRMQDKTDLGRDTPDLPPRRRRGGEFRRGAEQRTAAKNWRAIPTATTTRLRKAKRLPDEVAVSEAGITAHDNLDIWDMPILFLLVILIRGGEWLLRRKWGVV